LPLIEVPNATFQPCMDSFLGAAAGVMRALGDEQDMEDLWGLSGLALNTQVHRSLDPVGLLPRQWDETLSSYMRRFGHESIAGLRDHFYTAKDLRELQFVWMDTIEKTLNDGRPALAYGLHGPAFGIIRGFDSDTEEYHVSTFMDGTRNDPINIQDFGSLKPPLIFVMLPAGPLAGYDYNAAAREAIAAL
jgi:hypothetical protein